MSAASLGAKKFSTTKSDFSIDHILNVAGTKVTEDEAEKRKFEWLSCTRYKPPKLPRQKKKEGIKRRKAGRNPRIPFSSSQVAFLEAKFLQSPYLSSTDVTQLASHLKLSETRVKIWFQNRRAREKRDKESKTSSLEKDTEQMEYIRKKSSEVCSAHFSKTFKYFKRNFDPKTVLIPVQRYFQILTPLDLSGSQIP